MSALPTRFSGRGLLTLALLMGPALLLAGCERGAEPSGGAEATAPVVAEAPARGDAEGAGAGSEVEDDLTSPLEDDADPDGEASADPADFDVAVLDARFPTEQYNGEVGSAKKVILNTITAGAPLPRRAPEAEAAEEDEAQAETSEDATPPELTIDDVLASDFAGEDFSARPTEALGEWSGIAIQEWKALPNGLASEAWIAAFDAWLAEFELVESTEIHTWELQLLDVADGQIGLEAKEALWVVGQDREGQRREDRMLLVFELRRPEDGAPEDWRITGMRAEEGRTALSAGPAFVDVTAAWMPGGQDQAGSEIYTDGGPVLGDIDADGDLDLFLPRQHAPARLYANDGRGQFTDVSTRWGLDASELAAGSNSGLLIDIDGDEALDLIVGLKQAGIRVLRNEGGAFRDVTGPFQLGGAGEWESLSAADADGDGDLDVYASNYNLIDSDHQPESYVDARDGLPNLLLINEGGRFSDGTAAAGLDVGNDRWTYDAAWADYDRDGDMDLYVANDYGPNQLFQNDGTGRFQDVAAEVGAEDFGNGMAVSWLDYDNDLDLDLYVSNMQSFAGNRITRLPVFPGTPEQQAQYRRFSQGNSLLANNGDGTFSDVTDDAGVRGAFWAWGSTPFDYDADGDLDIYTAASFYTGASAADT